MPAALDAPSWSREREQRAGAARNSPLPDGRAPWPGGAMPRGSGAQAQHKNPAGIQAADATESQENFKCPIVPSSPLSRNRQAQAQESQPLMAPMTRSRAEGNVPNALMVQY